MAVRLFSQFGVRCLPQVAAAYTIHPGAVTTTVFTPQTVGIALQIFDRAQLTSILDIATVDQLQRSFFHQFILAGTWRSLKDGDRSAARRVYALFDLPGVRALGSSPGWLPVRAAFAVLSGALWRRRFRSCVAVLRSRDEPGSAVTALPGADSTGGHRDCTEAKREW